MSLKNKLLKYCSIKNVLIVLCVLILLYLIYDTYVVRENFEDEDGYSQDAFNKLFGVDDLTKQADEIGGFDDALDNYCEQIKALNALCTKCDTKADELPIPIENGTPGYIIDKSGYEARGADDLSLDPNNNFNVPTQALKCAPGYGRFDANGDTTKSSINGLVQRNGNGWELQPGTIKCEKQCDTIPPSMTNEVEFIPGEEYLRAASVKGTNRVNVQKQLRCKANHAWKSAIYDMDHATQDWGDNVWAGTATDGEGYCDDGQVKLVKNPCTRIVNPETLPENPDPGYKYIEPYPTSEVDGDPGYNHKPRATQVTYGDTATWDSIMECDWEALHFGYAKYELGFKGCVTGDKIFYTYTHDLAPGASRTISTNGNVKTLNAQHDGKIIVIDKTHILPDTGDSNINLEGDNAIYLYDDNKYTYTNDDDDADEENGERYSRVKITKNSGMLEAKEEWAHFGDGRTLKWNTNERDSSTEWFEAVQDKRYEIIDGYNDKIYISSKSDTKKVENLQSGSWIISVPYKKGTDTGNIELSENTIEIVGPG